MSDSKKIKICNQTNIPQVDNTALECSDCGFISTRCIIRPEAISYLGLPEDSDLTVVIDTLMLSLIDARNRLFVAEGKIATLQSFH